MSALLSLTPQPVYTPALLATTSLEPLARPMATLQSDKFSAIPQRSVTKPRPLSTLGSENKWLMTGAILAGVTGFFVSLGWLWSTIGSQRFFQWEGLHANIPMATVGGIVAGGAGGALLCRFVNSIKVRLNSSNETTSETNEKPVVTAVPIPKK
jgi:hypothetical protein